MIACCGGRNWRSWLKGWMRERRSWWSSVVRTWTSLRQTVTFASKYLIFNIIIIIIIIIIISVLLELQTYRYNDTVNIHQAVTRDRNGTAQTWPVCNKGITQLYLPPTHEPFLVCTPSHRASPLFGRCSLRLPTKRWPGIADKDTCNALGIEPGYGHPSQYYPGPTLINFVDQNHANQYARPPPL